MFHVERSAEAGGSLGFRHLDVDEILFELMERVQRLEVPRTGRLLDQQGMTFAASCKCGHRERTFAEIQLEESGDEVFERWVCAQCDALWVFNVGEISVHEVRLSCGPGLEDRLSEIEQLANALKLLDKWEDRLYLQLYLWEDQRDRATIAKVANKRWRTSRWSEWKVRRAISSAQHKIHGALGLASTAALYPNWTLEDHRP